MATNTKNQGMKAKSAAAASDVIVIKWYETQYTKFAGDQKLRTYRDPLEKHILHELRDPSTATKDEPEGQLKPFTIFGGKTMKLNISTNQWHKAVYEFILGLTEEEGPWRGHPSFNPGKKLFSMENVTEKAKRNNLNRKQIRTLQTKVEAMGNERLAQFGILFGFDPKKDSYDDILDGIEKIIETPADDPDAFHTAANIKDLLENPDFDYLVLVAVLKANNTFKNDGGIYKYNGATIAASDDQLIQWLKDNSTVFTTLKDKYLAVDDVATDK